MTMQVARIDSTYSAQDGAFSGLRLAVSAARLSITDPALRAQFSNAAVGVYAALTMIEDLTATTNEEANH